MTMNENDKVAFRTWLKKHTKLSDKVIRDTSSRLCRVEKIIPLQTNVEADDFLFKLSKDKGFDNLSSSVKSQLKRAYRLYHEHKTGR